MEVFLSNAPQIQQILLLIVAAIGISLFLMAAFGLFPRRRWEARQIKRAVRRQGATVLSSIKIPDGMDGHIFIDYLVLTAEEIRVITVKRYEGLIYAGEKLDYWTQVVRQSNYQFFNPLKELDLKLMALRALVPEVPVSGWVLFTEICEFPTRQPHGVIRVGDPIPAFRKQPIPEHLKAAWLRLRKLCQD